MKNIVRYLRGESTLTTGAVLAVGYEAVRYIIFSRGCFSNKLRFGNCTVRNFMF